jgi:hypothetical protein
MSKFLSGRQSNLNIGITSYTESKTVLQTTGKVGIGTTDAQQHSLFVVGSTNITDEVIVGGGLTAVGIGSFQSDVYIDNQLYVAGVNITGGASIGEDVTTRNLEVTGVSTFTGAIDANGDLDVDGHTELDDLNVSGVSTFTGAADFNGDVDIDGNTELDNLNVSGVSTFTGAIDANGDLDVDGHTDLDNVSISGVTTTTGLIDANGGIDANSVKVEDLTNDRIVVVGAGGELEDSANLTFDGVTLDVVGQTEVDDLNVSGIATISSLDVQTNFDVYDVQATFHNDLYIAGNLSIGGTTTVLNAQDLKVFDKDIVLGVTTDTNGEDISTDNTANHGGIAIASTEGSPLVPFFLTGVNEDIPDTYKQIMWVKSDSYGFGTTDAWLFNYAVGIGSTLVPNGTRLAVSEIQFTDDTINAPNLSISKDVTIGGDIDVDGQTELDHLNVSGVSTFVGITTNESTLFANQLSVSGFTTVGNIKVGGFTPDGTDFGGTQYILRAIGDGTWEWADVPGIFSVNNILNGFSVSDEGVVVGTAGSITQIDFRGANIVATADPQPNGIATVTMSDTPTFDSLRVTGLSTFVGITTNESTLFANQLSVSGITTFYNDVTIKGSNSDLVVESGTIRTRNVHSNGTSLEIRGGGNTSSRPGLILPQNDTSDVEIIGYDGGSTDIILDTRGSGNIELKQNSNIQATIDSVGIAFTDNVQARFGTSQDLKIYHNSLDSWIQNTGTGNLKIAGDDVEILSAGGASKITATTGGSVDLYHDSVKRLETTGYGVSVYNTLQSPQLNITGVGTISGVTFNGGSIISGQDIITRNLKATGISTFVGITTVESTLFTNQLSVAGVSTFQGNVNLGDDDRLRFGAGQDLQIYHDSATNSSYINESGSGRLEIRGSDLYLADEDGTTMLYAANNAGVSLYYGGGKTFETTGYGITVYDTVQAPQLNISGIASVGAAITMYGATGIISATSFYGDGSNLANTGSTLSPASGTQRVVLTSLTSGTMVTSSTDGDLTYDATNDILNVSGINVAAASTFGGTITAVDANFSGNVTIGGTLTYEDVTNIDSIGIITARSDVRVGGNFSSVGITTLASAGGITTTGGDLYVGQDLYFNGEIYQAGQIFTSGVGIGSTTVNPSSGFIDPIKNRIGVGFTDINIVGTGISVTGYGSTIVIDFGNIAAASGGALSISTVFSPRLQDVSFVGGATTSVIGVSTQTDRFVYDTQTGSVGIGTSGASIPQYKLDVNGDINSSTSVKIQGVDVLEEAVRLAIAFG